MACGCSKGKRQITASAGGQSYQLTMPDGSTSQHATRLEAQAANARAGGGGKVRTVKAAAGVR